MKKSIKRSMSIFLVLIFVTTLFPITGQAGFFSNIASQIKAKTNIFTEIGNKLTNLANSSSGGNNNKNTTASTTQATTRTTGVSDIISLANKLKNAVNKVADIFKKLLGTSSINITEQPKDKNNVLPGNLISISAKAKGDHLSYQWYYKRESDGAFVKWKGKTQSTITFKTGENDDGMLVYCEITDKNGNKTRTGQSRIGLVGGKQADPSAGTGILINGNEGATYTIKAGQGAELTLKSGKEDITVEKWYLKGPDGKWIPVSSNNKMNITWEQIKQYYPDWDGKKPLNVEFSCNTNDDRHLSTNVAFSKEPRPSGYYTQQKNKRLKKCNIAEPETNDYSNGDPVYIFFPGTAEMDSTRKVVGFEKKYSLYDNADANIISVATRTKSSGFSPKDWRTVATDVADYLEEKYRENPFPIRIDTVSYGGKGGICTAQMLIERGIPVEQINLGDSCGPMGAYTIKAEELEVIAQTGTKINIVASDRSSAWSKGTRQMIEDTKEVENINGYIVHGSHGEALGMGIHEYGIHDEDDD